MILVQLLDKLYVEELEYRRINRLQSFVSPVSSAFLDSEAAKVTAGGGRGAFWAFGFSEGNNRVMSWEAGGGGGSGS